MGKWEPAIKWRGNRGLAQYKRIIPPRSQYLGGQPRETLYRFVVEGLAPPDGLPTFTRDEIGDPRHEIQRQMDSKPGFLEALLRDRIKKIRSGILAGPIPGGLLAEIGGKPVIVMPSQDSYNSNLALMGVEQDKNHLCFKVTPKNPLLLRFEKGTDSCASQDLSSLYSNGENTCTFPQLQDKAAFCAAFDAAGKYDITGFFSQCRAHEDLRRYQAELLPMGGGTFAVYINMNIMFGNAKAVSWCRAGLSAIHRALDTIEPEVFSTSGFHTPSSFDLKPSKPWRTREGEGWFGEWKTYTQGGNHRTNTIQPSLLSAGDTVVGAVDRGVVPATVVADERIKKAVGSLRAHGIKISEAKIEPAAESMIVTGTELNFRDKTLSFPAEKWHTFDEKVRAVTEAGGEVSIESILQATEVAAEVANLFCPIKAYLIPICKWTAQYAFIREGNTFERLRKRRILKETQLKVPKILSDLLARGWRRAQERRVVHCRHLLMLRKDATCKISADIAGRKSRRLGMGAINHSTLQMFREEIPRDHPLSDWKKDCQESCCFLGALEVLTRPGDMVIFHEPNKTTLNDKISFRVEGMQAAFVIRFAQICDEKNLIIRPRRYSRKRWKKLRMIRNARTDHPSRWVLPKERTTFDKKCGNWGIDPKRTETISWNWRRTYDTWMRIQANYSLLNRLCTIGQSWFPLYSPSKSGSA